MNSKFDSFYLTNNSPYAERIEYEGHSTQAPDGMVRINAIKFQQTLNEVARGET